MTSFPILPIWLMTIICLVLIIITFIFNKKAYVFYIIIGLLFLVNLRFMYKNGESKKDNTNIDVLFVIDTSFSMVAEDYNGKTPRLDGIRKDCKKIVNDLKGARFGLITFNKKSNVLLPLTEDPDLILQYIDYINPPDYFSAEGSSLNVPKKDIISSLEDNYENRYRVIIFISDGEQISMDGSNEKLESYSEIKKYINDGVVLGYGTSSGGPMNKWYTYKDEGFSPSYIQSREKYEDALSKIDENNLKQIANDLGAKYVNMNNGYKLKDFIKEINKKSVSKLSKTDQAAYDDIYFLIMIPIYALLVYIFITYSRRS